MPWRHHHPHPPTPPSLTSPTPSPPPCPPPPPHHHHGHIHLVCNERFSKSYDIVENGRIYDYVKLKECEYQFGCRSQGQKYIFISVLGKCFLSHDRWWTWLHTREQGPVSIYRLPFHVWSLLLWKYDGRATVYSVYPSEGHCWNSCLCWGVGVESRLDNKCTELCVYTNTMFCFYNISPTHPHLA